MKSSRIISGLAAAIITLSGTGIAGYADVTPAADEDAVLSSEAYAEDAVVDERVLNGGNYYNGSEYPFGAVDYFTDGDYEFVVVTGTQNAWLKAYNGKAKNIIVPSTVSDGKGNQYKVTALLSGLFSGYESKIVSVNIPEGVTSVGNYVFSGNTELNSVTLPSTLRGIGYSAFSGCTSLKSVALPSKLEVLSDWAFENAGLTSVTVPDSVTELGHGVFSECKDLVSAKLPAGLGEVSDYLFSGCEKLSSVTIPANVKKIGRYTFSRCKALRSLALPSKLEEIGQYAFSNSGLTSLDIPASVKVIDNYAFINAASLSTFTGLENVSEFKYEVFKGTAWLAQKQAQSPFVVIRNILIDASKATGSVVVPSNVEVVNYGAFENNDNITSVRFAGRLEVLRMRAFARCDKLTSIDLGNTVQRLGSYVFSNSRNLTSITLPASMKIVRAYAFSGSYIKNLTLPDSIEMLSKYGLFGSYGDMLTVTITKKTGKLSKRDLGDKLPRTASLIIGDGITEIDNCFYNRTTLDSVTIPSSVTKIGERAFGYYLVFTDKYGYNHTSDEVWYSGDKTNYSYMCDDTLSIFCYNGTAAEQYAKANGFKQVGASGSMKEYSNKDGVVFVDVNGDGKVVSSDLTLMQQYLAGWKVVLNLSAADVTGDGKFDQQDIVRFQQYMAGWNVTFGK